jgi:hypothetical protein
MRRLIWKSKLVSAVLAGCLLTVGANAHHSHATIDKDDVRVYSGVVVKYGWTMPHVYLKVNAPDEKGAIVEYSIELNHPPFMRRAGWKKDTWKPGDHIIWQGAHDKDKNRAYTSLHWAEKSDGTRLDALKPLDLPVTPSTDFTGLWKRNDVGGFKPHYYPPEGWPLTAKGQELVDNFHDDQDPMVRCGNPGPPKMMIVPYPVSITRPDEHSVVMERELMTEKRIIHLDPDHEPGEPSKLGHSIGRFEDEYLIVETDNFIADDWGFHTGISSSEQKHLLEKYWMSDDGMYLHVEFTVTDPVFLTEPHSFTHRWIKLFDRDVVQAPCTMESAQLYLEGGYESQ